MTERWHERRSGGARHADDARTDFEVDYARVVHSGSFRRLQGKTQILSLGDDDFYRTRLTHSLEVAQVAEGILQHLRRGEHAADVAALLPPAPLIQAVGLAHDLGHPPFGHGGELALNYCMRRDGGFEGNAQTLRLLTRLEAYTVDDGADLTRRALLGILKYPVPRSAVLEPAMVPSLASGTTTIVVLDNATCRPPKACYDEDDEILDWILAPLHPDDRRRFQTTDRSGDGHGRTGAKSLDCSIMDVADDVAYGVHDLEDAIALGFIDEGGFRRALPAPRCGSLIDALASRPLAAGDGYEQLVSSLFGDPTSRKRAIGRLVHHFIRGVALVYNPEFREPLLARRARLPSDHQSLLSALQRLIVAEVIESPRVQHLEFKGQRMVVAVFEALMSDPERLLPAAARSAFEASGRSARIVCDHIASFTDAALVRTYERLFSPRSGSVFDRL